MSKNQFKSPFKIFVTVPRQSTGPDGLPEISIELIAKDIGSVSDLSTLWQDLQAKRLGEMPTMPFYLQLFGCLAQQAGLLKDEQDHEQN